MDSNKRVIENPYRSPQENEQQKELKVHSKGLHRARKAVILAYGLSLISVFFYIFAFNQPGLGERLNGSFPGLDTVLSITLGVAWIIAFPTLIVICGFVFFKGNYQLRLLITPPVLTWLYLFYAAPHPLFLPIQQLLH